MVARCGKYWRLPKVSDKQIWFSIAMLVYLRVTMVQNKHRQTKESGTSPAAAGGNATRSLHQWYAGKIGPRSNKKLLAPSPHDGRLIKLNCKGHIHDWEVARNAESQSLIRRSIPWSVIQPMLSSTSTRSYDSSTCNSRVSTLSTYTLRRPWITAPWCWWSAFHKRTGRGLWNVSLWWSLKRGIANMFLISDIMYSLRHSQVVNDGHTNIPLCFERMKIIHPTQSLCLYCCHDWPKTTKGLHQKQQGFNSTGNSKM